MTEKRVLLLAGEASGLLYATRLRERILRRMPSCVFRGYADEGFRIEDLAVMGFWPVFLRLFFFLRVAWRMKRIIRTWHPDVVVTVDYPGMNLKLAAYAKKRGIPAIHIVAPQVWAWHRDRIPKIERAVTKLLCFFPFEPALFPSGCATFIGHPMYDIFREEEACGSVPARERDLVAVLPGSRMGEIRRILPRLLTAVRGLDWRIPAASDRAYAEICRTAAACGVPAAEIEVRIRRGGARALLRQARCAAVASGTATLEAGLAGCPTVVVYAVSASLARFARRVIREIRHIGIVNVIAEKTGLTPPMPEFLQERFTSEDVRKQLVVWLDDAAAHADAVASVARVTARLHTDADALDVAAQIVVTFFSET